MADKWTDPTPRQNKQAERVQTEVVDLVNCLIREGIDPRVVIAGLGAATADTLTSVFGNTAVLPWFERQAAIARDVLRDGA